MTNPENDRYAELKAFIAEWFRPLEPGDGCTEEEIVAAEMRLGFRLPAALREFYLIAGRFDLLAGDYFEFIAPESLKNEDSFVRFIALKSGWEDTPPCQFLAVRQAGEGHQEDGDPMPFWIETDENFAPYIIENSVSVCLGYLTMAAVVNGQEFSLESPYEQGILDTITAKFTPVEDRCVAWAGRVYRFDRVLALLDGEIVRTASNDAAALAETMWNMGYSVEEKDFFSEEEWELRGAGNPAQS